MQKSSNVGRHSNVKKYADLFDFVNRGSNRAVEQQHQTKQDNISEKL